MKVLKLNTSEDIPPAYTGMVQRPNRQEWYKEGLLHRIEGPAQKWEGSDSDYSWYFEGKRHRVGGQATEWASGDKAWWFRNKLHRTDGPASEVSRHKSWLLLNLEITLESSIVLVL